VGKSSLFKAMTLVDVAIAEYPFTTIEANKGIGYVRVEDPGYEFGVASNPRYGFLKGKYRFVPIEIIDVPGLVPGAHEGRGLGNKFLDNLRQADALILVIDASGSTNEEGEFIGYGNYDPSKDIDFLIRELDMWIYSILERNWNKSVRLDVQKIKPKETILHEILSGLKISEKDIKCSLIELGLEDKSMQNWSNDDKKRFASMVREVSKKIAIAANKADLPSAKENIEMLKKKYKEMLIVPTSAVAEIALRKADKNGIIEYIPGEGHFKIIDDSKLNEKQKEGLKYIEEKVLKVYGNTGVQNILDKVVFDVLKYIAVFPAGVNKLADKEGRVLPDCFLLPTGSTALDFARAIHEDFAKNFIKVIDARTKRAHGKDYILKHRDVLEVIFGR